MGFKPGSLHIGEQLNQVQTLDLIMEDKHGELNYAVTHPIEVDENAVTLFAGDIDEVTVQTLESPYNINGAGAPQANPVEAREFVLKGTGLNHLATRLCTGAFSAQVKVPLATVVAALAAPLGLATDILTDPSGLALSNAFLSEQESIADVLTRLADLATGLSGIVHFWKIAWPGTSFSSPTLYFRAVTNYASTNSIGTGGYAVRANSIKYSVSRQQFANSVVLKLDRYLKDGGTQQTENKLGSDIFSGTLTLAAPLASQPKVTVNGTEETVGVKDADTGMDWYWQLGSSVLTVGASSAGGSDTVDVEYVAHSLFAVTQEDAASVASFGRYQVPVQSSDSGNVSSPIEQAKGELFRRSGFIERLTVQVRCPPGAFLLGQLIGVSLTGLGVLGTGSLSGYFYCSGLRQFDEDAAIIWRELDLVRGPMLYRPIGMLRRL